MNLRDTIDAYLLENLSNKRYRHCLGVERTAIRIARSFGLSEEKCSIAGLAHDICREWVPGQLEEMTGRKHDNPLLLHGEAGALFLKKKFGIQDRSILHAVKDHVSGNTRLDETGKAVFAADFLEEGRDHLNSIERERLFSLDLDDMVLEIALSIKMYLEKKGLTVEPAMMEMIEVLS